jgi:drug/metabolite transporter (DMT)-like permease
MPTPERPAAAWVPRLQVIGASLLFSTAGAAIKACRLSGWQVAGVRAGIAALFVWILVPGARRGWDRRVAAVSVVYAATVILFVQANKLTTAANAIFIQAASPLFLVLLGPALLKEPVRRRDLVFLLAVVVGLSLFFVSLERPAATAPDPGLGNLVAAASCLSVAFLLAGLRWLERSARDGGMRVVVAGNLLAFTACLPFAWPFRGARPADWAILTFLGVVQIGLGYLLLLRGMRHVTALEAALLLNLEPVLNPVWAFLLHGEQPGALALLGGGLILCAVVARTWLDARPASAAQG